MYPAHEQAAHNEYTEAADNKAVQPSRLSLETLTSSPPSIRATLMDNITAINTDMIINPAAATSSSSMSTSSGTVGIHPNTTTSAATMVLGSINTTSSDTINISTTTSFAACHEGNDMHNPTTHLQEVVLNKSSGFLGGNNMGVVDNSTSGFGSTSSSGSGEVVNGCKRKRDWMNSLSMQHDQAAASTSCKLAAVGAAGRALQQQQQQDDAVKGKSSASLLTSIRITNALYSFPAGWDQYLDLQTGETYYVNWNTRTKHCRVQCPEVQKCLAGAHQAGGGSGTSTLHDHMKTISRNNTDSVENWLSKLTATTSALVNNKPQFLSKPPLPPSHPFKFSKPLQQHTQGLDISSITAHRPKRLTSTHPPHCALTSKVDAKVIASTTPVVANSQFTLARHASMSTHLRDFCSSPNPNMDVMHSFNLSPKPDNIDTSSTSDLEVASTHDIDPLTFVCPNCNMFVMVSCLTSHMQCPSCNHYINKWSEDTMCSPCGIPSNALPLQIEPLTKARSL